MRRLLVILLIWSLSATATWAACGKIDRDQPCATANGHYRIALPKRPGPYPTVLYLYGSTGHSGEIFSSRYFVNAFLSRGYALIVPAALDIRYRDGHDSGWILRNEGTGPSRNDAAFVAEVLRDAADVHGIDRNNVLIAGMSRGGFLTWEIACHNPGLARAYAPVAAGYLGPIPASCRAPVRLLHTHGRADNVVPLDPDASFQSGRARMHPLDHALEAMAITAGCRSRADPAPFRGYERTQWTGCLRGASVDLLLHNGGHDIPRSWYTTVLDWFEQPPAAPRQAPPQEATAGGSPVFKRAGDRGSRFQKVPQN